MIIKEKLNLIHLKKIVYIRNFERDLVTFDIIYLHWEPIIIKLRELKYIKVE